MKKYLLPSALILLLGLGVALAQNITKAIQLSQDATGAFGVDANNNVYFPAHMLNNGPGVPIVASTLGAATITSTSTDNQGVVTGAASGTVTITFSKAYLAAPACFVASENPATSPLAYNVVLTGINITTSVGSAIINYICLGAK